MLRQRLTLCSLSLTAAALMLLAGPADAGLFGHGSGGSAGSAGSYGSYGSGGSAGSYGSYGSGGSHGGGGLFGGLFKKHRRGGSHGSTGSLGSYGSYGSGGSYGSYGGYVAADSCGSSGGYSTYSSGYVMGSYGGYGAGSYGSAGGATYGSYGSTGSYGGSSYGSTGGHVESYSAPVESYSTPNYGSTGYHGAAATTPKFEHVAANGSDRTALFVLNVPAEATVYFAGQKMDNDGARRTFVSPELAEGKVYSYAIRVTLDGQEVAGRQKIRGGDRIELNINLDGDRLSMQQAAGQDLLELKLAETSSDNAVASN